MAEISERYETYTTLLGGNSLDAAAGTLFAATTRLNVNPNQRILLIGIGGAGNNTINCIKGMLIERMAPGWSDHIAFLAIDSDSNMLDSLKYITDQREKVITTRENVENRVKSLRAMSLASIRSIDSSRDLPDIDWGGPGSGQRRVAGRVKIHDKAPGNQGVDQEIVDKIQNAWNNLQVPVGAATNAVYVIGSICGGTCSGAIQDMPALVRHALVNRGVKIYGMLFTPDAMAGMLPPDAANRAKANAYAALKEINYYQGVANREGDVLVFPYNDIANVDIRLTEYFDEPMLIGSAQGDRPGADLRAEQTVAEYLLQQFAILNPAAGDGLGAGMNIESILHNSSGGFFGKVSGEFEMELSGEAHEFPRCFGAVGFAKMGVPYKVMKAYAVSRICTMSGIRTGVENNNTVGDVIPFREGLFSAPEGTNRAKGMTQDFNQILGLIHNAHFSIVEKCLSGEKVTFQRVKSGQYDTCENMVKHWVDKETQPGLMEDLEKEISKKFQEYRLRVIDFVKQEGPLSFVNLYRGNFIKDGEDAGIGIRARLSNLMQGKQMDGLDDTKYITLETAKENLMDARTAINNSRKGYIASYFSEADNMAQRWAHCFNTEVEARVNEKRHTMAIGRKKYIDTQILEKADVLTKQLEKFGHLLNALVDVYASFENQTTRFETFKELKDSECDLNLAGMDPATYNWLMNKADTAISGLNFRLIREQLIDSFMENPTEWLDDANAVEEQRKLKSPNMPIKARTLFDQLIGEHMNGFNLNLSVKDIITYLNSTGQDLNMIAQNIINRLSVESAPQFDGNIATGTSAKVLLFPANLIDGGNQGPAIAAALQSVANGIGITNHFLTNNDNEIMIYNCVNELPVYKQNNLKDWESQYLVRVGDDQIGLHGLAPHNEQILNTDRIQTYVDVFPWKNHQVLTVLANDPTVRDVDGRLSPEGEIRLGMKTILAEAKKYGVISYRQNNRGNWICERVWLNRSVDWKFDVAACPVDEDGLIPTGEKLILEVIAQNDQNISSFTRQVRLNNMGLMDGEFASLEQAEFYVPRILRAHVSMYLQIKETLAYFTGNGGWGEQVDAYNRLLRSKKKPQMFVRILIAGKVRINARGIWEYVPAQGRPILLFNPAAVKVMTGAEQRIAKRFVAYYLFQKLQDKLESDEAFVVAASDAENVILDRTNNGGLEQILRDMEFAQGLVAEGAERLIRNGADLKDPNVDYEDMVFSLEFREFIARYVTDEEKQKEFVSFYAKALDELNSDDSDDEDDDN